MKKLILLGAIALMTMASPAMAKTYNFDVVRKGEKIGTHKLSVNRAGDKTQVSNETRIEVKVLFVTAYHFEFDGTETWQDGKLARLDTRTNDNGVKHNVLAERQGNKLAISADGKAAEAPATLLPTAWWNKAVVSQKKLLDIWDGGIKDVTVARAGSETIDLRGKPVKADHYTLQGEKLNRELWYDSKTGEFIKLATYGKDGSLVEYVLQ